MPNRILKESIRESYSVDALTDKAEITFYRLITYADDYGRFKADPMLLLRSLFPLRDYDADKVTSWMDELGIGGIVAFYMADGKPYGYFTCWDKHQQQRAKKSKHPDPPDEPITHQLSTIMKKWKSDEINGNQMKSDVTVIQSNPIQSNPNPIREKNTIEKREKDFATSVLEFSHKYPMTMLFTGGDPEGLQDTRSFFGYWTEHNDGAKKMKFELGKTFDISRRLATWASREKNWEGNNGRSSQIAKPGAAGYKYTKPD